MTTIKSKNYNIYIGENSIEKLNQFLSKNIFSKYIIICDENSSEHCLPKLLFACEKLQGAEIIELESGEENKTLETCANVWGALTDIGVDRKSLIINLGGGVISDLGGFVASTYKRGINFINIPTTLLSMVDASVGGKTGVDFDGIKNLIGTISTPKAIFIYPSFLDTLSQRQIKNGFAEIIKIALIADFKFWQELKKSKLFYSDEIIAKAVELKNNIVKKDLYENDLRKSLNFGHSIGHAIESAYIKSGKDILHGEAIASGMIMESYIAMQQKKITKKEFEEINIKLKSIYTPIKLTKEIQKLLFEFIQYDKKNESDNLCFALPSSIGSYKLSCGISENQITEAIKSYQTK
jgi:3-dehydroquinate synthase